MNRTPSKHPPASCSIAGSRGDSPAVQAGGHRYAKYFVFLFKVALSALYTTASDPKVNSSGKAANDDTVALEIRFSAHFERLFLVAVIFLVLVFFNFKTDAAAPNQFVTSWIRQFGTTGQDVGEGISADRLGNVYVTGFAERESRCTLFRKWRRCVFAEIQFQRKCHMDSSIWNRQCGSSHQCFDR